MSERLACVLLVDERGAVLLEQRPDGSAQRGLPGARVNGAESFEEAAYRGLAEEAGVHLHLGHLYLWRDEEVSLDDGTRRVHVYVGRVDGLRDADVQGAGFVTPDAVGDLERSGSLSATAAHVLPAFLGSEDHTRLAGFRTGGRDEPLG